MQIKIIEGLTLDAQGILINNNKDYVHFRQGDMDGACGPYCIAMAMMVLNRISRDALQPAYKIDYRTAVGKMLREIHNLDPLVMCGATKDDLVRLIGSNRLVSCQPFESQSRNVMREARAAIERNHPVILDLRSSNAEGLYHWVLAIGASNEHFYLLDPSHEIRAASFWNSTLTTTPSTTRYGYRYSNQLGGYNVEVSTMIEII